MLYSVRKDLPFYTSLKILETLNYFRKNNQSKFRYFAALCIWCLMWNATVIGAVMSLFISSIIKRDYYLAATVFPLAVEGCAMMATNIIFGVNYEMWSELLGRTVDYTKFGKSLKFDKINRQGEKMGKIIYRLAFFSIILISIFTIFAEKACLLKDSGRNEICGLMIPYWLPAKLASSIVFKRFVLLHQIYTSLGAIVFIAILSLQNQVCEFIGDKVKHLSVMFNKINTAETSKLQYQQFSFCMEYYQDILELCEQLNTTSQRTVGHITFLTVVVVSVLLYHGTRGNYSMFWHSGIYVLNLGFMCHTGQKIEDAMFQVGESLYLSNWYDYSMEIQKIVPIVIMRSQRFVGLRAVPIGRLNYFLFSMVMKTTYSYLNLIKDTGTH